MKERKYKHICKFCNKEYLGADIKGNRCYECRENIVCRNCNKKVAYGWSIHRKVEPGVCSRCFQKLNKGKSRKETIGITYKSTTKGKNYLQIYGTSTPLNGFKKGDLNTAKRVDVRAKISKGVSLSYTQELRNKRGLQTRKNLLNGMHWGSAKWDNGRGEKFRSKLEVYISNLLYNNKIDYKYEGSCNRILLEDGSIKVVDFIVDNIIIEVTGFAYKKWQDDFLNKIKKLSKVTTKNILILTYSKYVDIIYNELLQYNVNVKGIEDSVGIISFIKGS
jgi:hypothetical protein